MIFTLYSRNRLKLRLCVRQIDGGSGRNAKLCFENNTVWYGLEKKKLWVNIEVCFGLPPSV